MGKGSRGGKRNIANKLTVIQRKGFNFNVGIEEAINKIENEFSRVQKTEKKYSANGIQNKVGSFVKALKGQQNIIKKSIDNITEIPEKERKANYKYLMSYMRKSRTLERKILDYGKSK